MYEADERREKKAHKEEKINIEVNCVTEETKVTEKIDQKEVKIKEAHTHVD